MSGPSGYRPAGGGRDEEPQLGPGLDRVLRAAQTPRQQDVARRIFSRLMAGDRVEDLQDLIGEMSRVVTAEHEEQRQQHRRAGG